MSSIYDVVVVGAGPGGIAAATIAGEAGLRVCLLDDNASSGGQIWRGLHPDTARGSSHGREFLHWMDRLQRTNCEVLSRWTAALHPAPQVLRLERDGEFRDVGFRRLILATGARERFLPFHGWTLPGVSGAGGLQALVKGGLEVKGKRVVVAGTGPLLLAIAAALQNAGAKIQGIYEQAPLARLAGFGLALVSHLDKLFEGARYGGKLWGVPYRTSAWVLRAEGADCVERVVLTDGHKQWAQDCDWLACGYHLIPNLELPRMMGCLIERRYVTVDLHQQSSIPEIACIGELTGIGGLEKAVIEGQIAGWSAAGHEAKVKDLAPRLKRMRRFAQGLDRAFALRAELRSVPTAETLVCRCEDVSFSDVRECSSWREAKLHARCGMGACQGRICGAATEFLFDWKQADVRPPVFPAAVSVMAAKLDSPEPVRR